MRHVVVWFVCSALVMMMNAQIQRLRRGELPGTSVVESYFDTATARERELFKSAPTWQDYVVKVTSESADIVQRCMAFTMPS